MEYSFIFVFRTLKNEKMNYLDLVLGIILVLAVFNGIKNGLFVEFTSLISLVLGVYIAFKFSFFLRGILSGFMHWNPRIIQVVAFIITFLIVISAISFLANFFTKIADFAHLGVINKLGGGFFRLLKAIVILSVFLNLFEKINFTNIFAKKQTLDKSLFYRPIQKTAGLIYPSIESWYNDLKKN
jgi:membrane protein required for colicin V production